MDQEIEDKFFRAVSHNDLETVSAMMGAGFEVNHIIGYGADGDIVDPHGNSLLLNAVGRYVEENGDEVVRYLLLDLNMDPSQKNNHGKSALDLFGMPKNKPIRHLFESGCKPYGLVVNHMA